MEDTNSMYEVKLIINLDEKKLILRTQNKRIEQNSPNS